MANNPKGTEVKVDLPYNPFDKQNISVYDVVGAITNDKTLWHAYDKAGDRQKANEYAEHANPYYKWLRDNGYSDVANLLQNTNDVGAQSYFANFQKNTVPESTMPDATDTSTVTGKINNTYDIEVSNIGDMKKSYDALTDYNVNHNPYESEIGKSIMANYQLQGKTESDNAVADGGASNGGNIDSFAAANAKRQQLAFTNAGTQAVLNDHNSRVSNWRGILNDMGINVTGMVSGLRETIGLQQTEEQRQFENTETSKNNEVDRNVKISEVTGYVPVEWAAGVKNNPYLNSDGTVKDEYKDKDFLAAMAEAKAKGNQQDYYYLSVARFFKINNDYEKYGKYDDGNYINPMLQQTESGRQFDVGANIEQEKITSGERMNQDDNATSIHNTEYTTDAQVDMNEYNTDAQVGMNEDNNATSKYVSDNNLTGTKYASDSEERQTNSTNATNLTITDKTLAAEAEAKEDKTWTEELNDYDLSENARTILNTYAYDAWRNGEYINILSVVSENSTSITEYDASEILRMYNISNADIEADTNGKIKTKAEWMKQYTWYDSNAKYDEYTPENVER